MRCRVLRVQHPNWGVPLSPAFNLAVLSLRTQRATGGGKGHVTDLTRSPSSSRYVTQDDLSRVESIEVAFNGFTHLTPDALQVGHL